MHGWVRSVNVCSAIQQYADDILCGGAADCLQTWVFVKSSMSTLLNISTCASGVSGPSLLLKPCTFAFVAPRFQAVLNLSADMEKARNPNFVALPGHMFAVRLCSCG